MLREKKNTNESRKHSNSLKSTGITINSVRWEAKKITKDAATFPTSSLASNYLKPASVISIMCIKNRQIPKKKKNPENNF
jgi:hypothetical protein